MRSFGTNKSGTLQCLDGQWSPGHPDGAGGASGYQPHSRVSRRWTLRRRTETLEKGRPTETSVWQRPRGSTQIGKSWNASGRTRLHRRLRLDDKVKAEVDGSQRTNQECRFAIPTLTAWDRVDLWGLVANANRLRRGHTSASSAFLLGIGIRGSGDNGLHRWSGDAMWTFVRGERWQLLTLGRVS